MKLIGGHIGRSWEELEERKEYDQNILFEKYLNKMYLIFILWS